jgi:hypothetical protein
MNSKLGTLQQRNETSVLIDSVWYDGTNVQNYLPSQIGIQVEYNADENNNLAFIREKKVYGGGGQTGGGKQPFTPKNTQSRSYKGPSKSSTQGSNRDATIIKQVIFKGTVELVKGFTYDNPDDMLSAFDYVYDQLEQKYANRLK